MPTLTTAELIYLIPAFGIIALAFTAWKSRWVAKQAAGTSRMERIAENIALGAMAFLRA
jgi:K(+)-stimulated pyrophosphate-energized sodium pump